MSLAQKDVSGDFNVVLIGTIAKEWDGKYNSLKSSLTTLLERRQEKQGRNVNVFMVSSMEDKDAPSVEKVTDNFTVTLYPLNLRLDANKLFLPNLVKNMEKKHNVKNLFGCVDVATSDWSSPAFTVQIPGRLKAVQKTLRRHDPNGRRGGVLCIKSIPDPMLVSIDQTEATPGENSGEEILVHVHLFGQDVFVAMRENNTIYDLLKRLEIKTGKNMGKCSILYIDRALDSTKTLADYGFKSGIKLYVPLPGMSGGQEYNNFSWLPKNGKFLDMRVYTKPEELLLPTRKAVRERMSSRESSLYYYFDKDPGGTSRDNSVKTAGTIGASEGGGAAGDYPRVGGGSKKRTEPDSPPSEDAFEVEQIKLFQDITESSARAAREYLSLAGNNLEQAVQLYLESSQPFSKKSKPIDFEVEFFKQETGEKNNTIAKTAIANAGGDVAKAISKHLQMKFAASFVHIVI